MGSEIVVHQQYKDWLVNLKIQFKQTQLKAVIQVNTSLLEFYWQLGSEITTQQQATFWGDGVLTQLSRDLRAEFPEVKGFSKRNLELMRQWYQFWNKGTIAKQAVSQLFQFPWGYDLKVIAMCSSHAEALFYIKGIIAHGWSRNVLVHQIDSQLWQRDGQSLNNFEQTLPQPQSDLATQQQTAFWGDGVLTQLSRALHAKILGFTEFPKQNLALMHLRDHCWDQTTLKIKKLINIYLYNSRGFDNVVNKHSEILVCRG